MPPQLDLLEIVTTLTQTVMDYRIRIADLEKRIALYDPQAQAQKLSATSRMHPKTRRVVFVGRSYFGDNIKYAFLDFVRSANQNDCDVWFMPPDDQQETIIKAAGLPCFPSDFQKWTAADIGRALETSVTVHCDHNAVWKWKDLRAKALFDGAKQVQMWHGISIKEIGLKYARGGDALDMIDCEILETSGRFDAFVGTSRGSEAEWRRFFIFDRYEPLGYPRNDALMREATAHDLLNVDMTAYERVKAALQEGKPVYVYAPTFRDHTGPAWFSSAGFQDVVARLAKTAVILINLHPFEQSAVPDLQKKHPDLFFLRPGTDLYPVLRFANALITDYSSLIFDFLLLDRPIVLFRPDHECYQAVSRALFEQKIAVPPGPICPTADELAATLESLMRGEDSFQAIRHNLRQTWFDHPDADSAARVTKLILSLLPA